MAFIDTSETIIGVEIQQIDGRFIEPGQPVELTFKFLPGAIQTGRVQAVLQAISSGQALASGSAVSPKQLEATPFAVRVRLDNPALAASLPAGSAGDAAIFTDHVKMAHMIRKVLLRQVAILNYILPF
jgi:multidrug resistance efflux pump